MRKPFYDLANNKEYGCEPTVDVTYMSDFPNLEEIGIVMDFETVGNA